MVSFEIRMPDRRRFWSRIVPAFATRVNNNDHIPTCLRFTKDWLAFVVLGMILGRVSKFPVRWIACVFMAMSVPLGIFAKVDTFVNSVGFHAISDDVSIRIFEGENGLFGFEHKSATGSILSDEGVIDPKSDWFVYIQEVNEWWIYSGESLYYIFDSENHSGIYDIVLYPNGRVEGGLIRDRIPKKVKSRLPDGFMSRIVDS